MSNTKPITAVVVDPHVLGIYEADTGNYCGILYVTSGTIVGQPIISSDKLSVNYIENGNSFINVYELPSRNFVRKIQI